ncbi:MAG: hypothetical protein GXP63_02235 [DPANN group archaeon]|nr:hypothetical protein [DPANN group archaeon]
MNLSAYIPAIIISWAGILVGMLLIHIAPEERTGLEKALIIMRKAMVVIIVVILGYSGEQYGFFIRL